MKVLIDADGCPVVDIVVSLCNQYSILCLILCDTSHTFSFEGTETLVFDKGADSVDFALVNRVQKGDIVVTQDYGLASMCLTRGARVVHQDGWEYTPENIDGLLLVRHESKKSRAAGNRWRRQRKRNNMQNQLFADFFRELLQTTLQG